MIMKSKLRSILGGVIPSDADYTRLVALVPDSIDDSTRHLAYFAKNSVPAWEIQLLSHIRNAAKKSQVDEMTRPVPVETGREIRYGVDAEDAGGNGYAYEDEEGNEDEEEDADAEEDGVEGEDAAEDEDEDDDDDGDGDGDGDEDSNSHGNSDRGTDSDVEMDFNEGSPAFHVGAAVDSRVSEVMKELEKAGLKAGRKV